MAEMDQGARLGRTERSVESKLNELKLSGSRTALSQSKPDYEDLLERGKRLKTVGGSFDGGAIDKLLARAIGDKNLTNSLLELTQNKNFNSLEPHEKARTLFSILRAYPEGGVEAANKIIAIAEKQSGPENRASGRNVVNELDKYTATVAPATNPVASSGVTYNDTKDLVEGMKRAVGNGFDRRVADRLELKAQGNKGLADTLLGLMSSPSFAKLPDHIAARVLYSIDRLTSTTGSGTAEAKQLAAIATSPRMTSGGLSDGLRVAEIDVFTLAPDKRAEVYQNYVGRDQARK